MPTLTDDSEMPFGKYKGKKMEDVPADYIMYMYDKIRPIALNKMYISQRMFVKYVEDNKDVLEKEIKEMKNGNNKNHRP
mgnify:CR=1 FL=1